MRALIVVMLLSAPALATQNTLVRGNTEFAFELYQQLAPTKGNLFFSPYSISSAMALTWAGARGATAREIAVALRFGNEDDVHPSFHILKEQLARNGSGFQLSIANRLFAARECRLLDGFTALARDRYGASIEQVDFAADASRVRINEWVRDQTQNRITNLLARGSIDPFARLVLVNAIYFKGRWETQFEEALTEPRPFTSNGKTFDVPTMRRVGTLERYGEADRVQMLELSYQNGDLAMLVLLPREKDGLGALEQQLDSAQLDRWISKLRPMHVRVHVYLPKFRVEHAFALNEALRRMGVVTAFGPAADFSGIDGERDLYISKAVHKAFVEVNEEGTEASAATGVVVLGRGIPPSEPVFNADHPFLFILRDRRSGSILFLGRVVDPR